MEVLNCSTPVGNFYMIIDGDTVIKSGFGKSPNLPMLKSHRYIDLVNRYFEGSLQNFDGIKFLQTGTDFQQKVWTEMSKVPYGQTANYAEIADKIGKPKTVRAVGSACGKNNLPLLIPCHRIIKSDGSIGDYAYGPKVKEHLLDLEKN